MRLLHLYRPRLPGLRAQAIQVVHTCRALSEQGFSVTLLADSSDSRSDLRRPPYEGQSYVLNGIIPTVGRAAPTSPP